jgi:hypothetical protein
MRTDIVTKLAGGAVAAAMLLGGAGLAFAQTATSSYDPNATVVPATPISGTAATQTTTTVVPSTTSSSTATPGVPNTGAGGFADENLAVLGASAAIAVLGGAYLMRRRFVM